MANILLVAHFCGEFDGGDNNRFNYLAKKLAENNSVELITSDYSHTKKHKRDIERINGGGLGYTITFIPEPAYAKNVSLNRFYSHYVFGRNLSKCFRRRSGKSPDVVYCAVPSLDAGYAAYSYCRKNNVPFIIDIQDLWPEAFRMVTNRALAEPVFRAMTRRADFIYKSADAIVAVSETYAGRAKQVNKNADAHSVYLGTELQTFDRLALENKPDKSDEIWLAYAGTLGHSYDLTVAIDAVSIAKDKGVNVKLIVMGDGPLKSKFEAHAASRRINAYFTGRLSYAKLAGMLKASNIAINPISRNAAQSIINKHADYAAAGLPVLNTQESPEYRKLVEDYEMGFNCDNNDSEDLAEKLLALCRDSGLRKIMSINSRRLAKEKFDRRKTYSKISEIINNSI